MKAFRLVLTGMLLVSAVLFVVGGLRASANTAAAPGYNGPPDTNPYSEEWLAQYHGMYDNLWTAQYESQLQGLGAPRAL
jgi:hypothetical protein